MIFLPATTPPNCFRETMLGNLPQAFSHVALVNTARILAEN